MCSKESLLCSKEPPGGSKTRVGGVGNSQTVSWTPTAQRPFVCPHSSDPSPPTMPPTVRPSTSSSSLASSARTPAKASKMRTLVNTVRFVNALSRKRGRPSNGVQNAGILKAASYASASSTGCPSRHQVTWSMLEKEPNAAPVIPSTWGIVDKLQSHFVAVTGVKYLVRCEAKTDWLTEGALRQRKDGDAALALYHEVPLHSLDAHLATQPPNPTPNPSLREFLDAPGVLRCRATGCA